MGANVENLFKESAPLWPGQERRIAQSPQQGNRIRLADFIHKHTKQIVTEWENFARTLTPAADNMTPLALRDHIHEILAFIVDDITSPQTRLEQIQKSHGEKEKSPTPTAAETHTALRMAGGFDIKQMVSEFRALRASVIKLWGMANTHMNSSDIIDLTRFNESIDQELAESVGLYKKKINYSKDLIVCILSHELRNPLNVVSMSAQLMLNMNLPDKQPTCEQRTTLATQIFESTSRIVEIVNNLLDATRARFGAGLPVIRSPMDMGYAGRQLVDEMRAANPTRTITLDVTGEVKGEWDKARIGQVFSNLLGNAIQYSFKDSSIRVVVMGAREDILLSVHNEGMPVPPEKIKTIFDALTRAVTDEGDHPEEVNLGLGLYITKEIVVAHGGTIVVTSTQEGGTTFIVRLPRVVHGQRSLIWDGESHFLAP